MAITLDARLLTAAEMARAGMRVVDVGTDHAYLPAWLVERGIISSAIATDIRPGPLRNAAETLRRAGLEKQVQLRLCDGLRGIEAEEADDIFICGMGGEQIAAIIADAPWLRDFDKQLILQPMTRAERLRSFLFRNGFAIREERVARDAKGRLYPILRVRYTGEVVQPTELLCRVGNMKNRDYLAKQARQLRKQAAGLRRAKDEGEAARGLELEQLAEEIENL